MNSIKTDCVIVWDYIKKVDIKQNYESLFVEQFIFDEYTIISTYNNKKIYTFSVTNNGENPNELTIKTVGHGGKHFPNMTIKTQWNDNDKGMFFHSNLKPKNDYAKREMMDFMNDVVTEVLGTQHMIMNEGRKRKQTCAKGGTENTSDNPTRINDESQIRNNKIYLLDDIIEIVGKMEKEEHKEMKCPCWQVRGFYRHLKSGQTIWVKPYLKGKERNKQKPKDGVYYI